MKIAILTFGSRGDVEPLLALAVGLLRAGHHPRLVAPQRYAEWIRSYGVEARTLRFDLAEFMDPKHRSPNDTRRHARGYRAFRQGFNEGLLQAYEDYHEASQDADFLVQGGSANGGVEIANALGIPMAFAHLSPFTPTRAFPAFSLRWRRSLGGGYNLFSQRMVLRVMWYFYGPSLNRWRKDRFGLPPWQSYGEMLSSGASVGTPVLLGLSPSLLPAVSDWDTSHHVTGFWFLEPPPDWQPPAALLQFLEAGPPPVYIGFGSMRVKDPARLTREVLRAVDISGQRGLLAPNALTRLPTSSTVQYIDDAPFPFHWLFPWVAAVVHHGGTGTTAAVVRAGLPNIIAPLVIDQHTWGERVQKLGIGLRLPRMNKLDAEQLAAAIRTVVSGTEMRARAVAFGEKMRAENGIATAVDLIERHAERFREKRAARAVANGIGSHKQ